MCKQKTVYLEDLIRIRKCIEKIGGNKYKIRYKHSNTTNSYYFTLTNSNNVMYQLRFSDHKSKDKMKTFYIGNKSQKDLEKFIKKGIESIQLKNVGMLINRISQ